MAELGAFRALLIDDDDFVRAVVARQLVACGAREVVECSHGDQVAQTLHQQGPFDLIVTDLMLPGTDGVELLRSFAALPVGPAVILISSTRLEILEVAKRVAEGRNLNILGTLQKPVLAASLRDIVSKLANEPRARRASGAEFKVSESELDAAITNGELVVFVQPKVSMANGQLCGVEALARWISPSRGVIPPLAFIPLAEQCGLMARLTEQICDRALAACEGWRNSGLDVQISVNVSASSLTNLDFPEWLVDRLDRYHADARQIVLEITESSVLENLVESLDVLTRLRLKGFGLSIDDFGTGYSSLLQLRRVPFTELKIDRAFVSSVMSDDAALNIIQSCIELARGMNLKVVAEGVETLDEWELLRGLGCDQAQGFCIAKPMPVAELVDWARRRREAYDESRQQPPTASSPFERLFEFSHDAVLLVGTTGLIERNNGKAADMFGYGFGELLGQSVDMLVPLAARDAHAMHRSGFTAAPKMRQMSARPVLFGVRRDGTELPVDILLSPVKARDAVWTLAIIRDLTRSLEARGPRENVETDAGHRAQ